MIFVSSAGLSLGFVDRVRPKLVSRRGEGDEAAGLRGLGLRRPWAVQESAAQESAVAVHRI